MYRHLRILSKSRSFKCSIVMSICHSCVQVTPGSYSCLLVPEPFCCYLRDVLGSHMRNSCSDFRSIDQSIKISELLSIGKGNMISLIKLEQIIKIFISSPKNLWLIDILSINRHLILSNNCHFLGIHLISINEITK